MYAVEKSMGTLRVFKAGYDMIRGLFKRMWQLCVGRIGIKPSKSEKNDSIKKKKKTCYYPTSILNIR